jgi:hypothetical protein
LRDIEHLRCNAPFGDFQFQRMLDRQARGAIDLSAYHTLAELLQHAEHIDLVTEFNPDAVVLAPFDDALRPILFREFDPYRGTFGNFGISHAHEACGGDIAQQAEAHHPADLYQHRPIDAGNALVTAALVRICTDWLRCG